MLFIVVAPAAACWLVPIGLHLIGELIASIIAIVLAARARRVVCALLVMRDVHAGHALDFDRKPSRAERRVIATGLRIALQQTQLTSLFPTVACRARSSH